MRPSFLLRSRRAPGTGSVGTGTPAAVAMLALALGGCTAFNPEAGFDAVRQTTRERLDQDLVLARSEVDLNAIGTRVTALLAQPLSAEAAVQIALLNNRGLQATLQALGITEAEVAQAGRLPNPALRFARLTRGTDVETDRSAFVNLARLLALPLIRSAQAHQQTQARQAAALSVLQLAADTRKAWVRAVAAEEAVRYTRQVQRAAEAGAELARRMRAAGNFNKLQQAREQSFQADATLNAARALQARRSTRERLTRLMGLANEAGLADGRSLFTLPDRLPDLPAAPAEAADIERRALAQRLDVQSATLRAEQTAQALGLTRATRFINVLELGGHSNTATGLPFQQGWEIGLELPLFDSGDARLARAEAVYLQALHRAAETAGNARSEVREAYGNHRSAWDIARHHRDEIVPLRQQIAEENVLRYNGMLTSVFELLADARAQIAAVNAALDALRDFWLAQADLDLALVGRPDLGAAAALPAGAPGDGPNATTNAATSSAH